MRFFCVEFVLGENEAASSENMTADNTILTTSIADCMSAAADDQDHPNVHLHLHPHSRPSQWKLDFSLNIILSHRASQETQFFKLNRTWMKEPTHPEVLGNESLAFRGGSAGSICLS